MASRQDHPMTSKQARQAYLRSTRTPRISRAEQLRLEREEQQRTREEDAQRVARERAQAARERKKQKEEEKRQERKRKGLPLVDARPSQDTIARFIRLKPPDQHESKTLAAVPEEDDDGEGPVVTDRIQDSQTTVAAAPGLPSCPKEHLLRWTQKRQTDSQSVHSPADVAPPQRPNPAEPPVKRPKTEDREPAKQARTYVDPCSRVEVGASLATRAGAEKACDPKEDLRALLGFSSTEDMTQDLDHLFSSATQLAREMEEGENEERNESTFALESDLNPRSGALLRANMPEAPVEPGGHRVPEVPFLCTQDFDFTIDDLLEIGEACPQQAAKLCFETSLPPQPDPPLAPHPACPLRPPRPPRPPRHAPATGENQQKPSVDVAMLCSQHLMSTQDILEIEGLVRPEHVTITSTSAKIVAPGPATGITCNEATTPLPKAASTNVGFEIVASPRGDTGEDSGEDSGVEPEPFFTSSGTQELIAMAMLRSRRTARQEERARKQALHHSRIAAPETAPLSPISSNPVRRHVRGDPMAADFKAANATVSRTVNKTGHDGKTTKANTIPKNDGADTQHAREDEYEWGDINDEDWDSVLAQCQSATNIL